MEGPDGHSSGVPSVVELLDELQRIRNMAPDEVNSAETRGTLKVYTQTAGRMLD